MPRLWPYLLSWWFHGPSSTLLGVLRIVIPGIILYQIWRIYASIVYGGDTSICTMESLMAIIRSEIYLWAKSIDNTKLASGYHSVQHLGILPPFHRKQSHVIRCIIPHSGRLKLNTDVADGRTFAAGGAILRNSTGECIGTLSFCLPISTPYHAELQTAYFAMLFFYLFIGTSF